MPNAPGPVAARLGRFGLVRPGEHVLTTLTERPDLDSHVDAHHAGMWAPSMVDSEVADRMFPWAPRAMGAYVVATATSPVTMDRSRDEGVYVDQNIRVVHEL